MAHRALRVITAAVLAAGVLTACTTEPAPTGTTGGTGKGSSDGKLVLGFAQVGAESGWRTANTKSVREAAEKVGITLKFSDAQQKQENQIKAIRTFIQQKVDVIAFSPVVESGWDTVLKEAKSSKHPGDPHRPCGRLAGHLPLPDLPRLRLRQGGAGEPASGS